jgi:hypothetical protein
MCLRLLLQNSECPHLGFGVLVDPPVVDHSNRYGIEVVQLLPPVSLDNHEISRLQDLQVLSDTESRHFGAIGHDLFQGAQRLPALCMKSIQYQTTSAVSQRLEDEVFVDHTMTIGDYLVTCQ